LTDDCSGIGLVAARHFGIVLVGHHEVPPVETVLAAVGNDVARFPNAVLAGMGEQEASTTTVDARDLGSRCEHANKSARRKRADGTEPSASARIVAGMRVVAGDLGGRRLVAPVGTATRPTTDRVREAVFNSLASAGLLDGALVADLFAGSGSIGIEALSRGAQRCVFVERDRSALQALRENLDTLDLTSRSKVLASDAMSVASTIDADLVFADPPYDFDEWSDLLGRIRADTVVAESGAAITAPLGWSVVRERRYGRTRVTFLERLVADVLPVENVAKQ